MSTPLVIADLDASLEEKLLAQAASHGRSREAEAAELLSLALSAHDHDDTPAAPAMTPETLQSAIQSVRGIWKGRLTTDEVMELTRGDDIDDAYTRR